MQTEVQSPKLSQFLAKMQPYFIGEPKIVSGEKVWNLKPNILSDGPVALNAIQAEAASYGITFSRFPSPKFSLKATVENEVETGRLYLHVADIEGGGPQPRTMITPDDPETIKLFKSIKSKGQVDPISVYPSPTTPGKYRIFDGHRRHMVIFTMLMKTEIKADVFHITEQHAFELAFVVHQRQNLTPYDQGHYILEELMKRFPERYSSQEVVGDFLGISQDSVSLYIRAYREVEQQKGKLTPEITNQFVKMGISKVALIQQLPEEVKPEAITQTVEKNLSREDLRTLVTNVKANPESTPLQVAEEAQRIKEQKADVRAQELMKDADKEIAKTERARDKVVAAGEEYPEMLMKGAFGYLGLKSKGKVSPEKARSLASNSVGVIIQKCCMKKLLVLDDDGQTHPYELDDVFREAETWNY